jgi:cellulose synthase/poly-beta-1,6-N-acetylglucosamine synthase-like glycosyltransferase
LLVLCGAAIAWILAGYPVVVWFLSRLRSRPVRKDPVEKTVTAIVAVHNGGHYLAAKLDSLLALDYPGELLDIIVVSDGSTDNTSEIAQSYADRRVRLLEVPKGGKCAAYNSAIPQAQGEILFLTDVRQPMDPGSLRYLLESFADETVGAVTGELVILKGDGRNEADVGAYWKFECWLRDSLAQIDSMMGASGSFYALRRNLAVPVPPHVLLDDMYLPLKGAFLRGYRLVMERRARAYDLAMPVSTEFRRKVRTLAGNYQLLWELPEMLGPRNRMWFHYYSYKLGRLALPWLLAGFFLLSFIVMWPLNAVLLSLQIPAWGLALADPIIPAGSKLKKLSTPAHTFLVMMWASMVAVKIFFVEPQDLWKVTGVQEARQPR